jgi:hypothetical protein
MRKTAILISLTVAFAVSSSACVILGSMSRIGKKDYEQAKSHTIMFITDYKDDIETVKNDVVDNKSADNTSLEGVRYISYEAYEDGIFIFFDYDGQGMLGGQYWGFYYSSNDIPRVQYDYQGKIALAQAGEKGCYYWWDEIGSNLYATERIEENWFFYYMDYDNNMHGLDWRS